MNVLYSRWCNHACKGWNAAVMQLIPTPALTYLGRWRAERGADGQAASAKKQCDLDDLFSCMRDS